MTSETSLIGKLSVDLDLKSNVVKLHKMLSSRSHETSKACPGKINSLELVEGEWGKEGCVMIRNYVSYDNQVVVDKARVDKIDNENYKYSYSVIEGPLRELYKSFKVGYEATAKGEGTNFHYTFEYEKMNKDIPEPDLLFQHTIDIFREIDAYLTKEQCTI
ncbi:hypothetical protein ACFE04_029764 [Oxalis oulophora]